jgi:2-C-methyl-D-erythritol 4-phosphate cytidylyltransferase / 2-C-methyl-D-erythritol 2,4-cyclodiphosphate synthase
MAMSVAAIIVAAGRGARANRATPKQFEPVGGRPMLEWSLAALSAAGVARIVLVHDPEHLQWLAPVLRVCPSVTLAPGEDARTGSVRAGLAACAPP